MMGNSPSASDNEEDDTTSHEDEKDDSFDDDIIESSEADNSSTDINNFGVKEHNVTAQKTDSDDESGPHTCTDLSQLFDHKSLRRFASKLKDDVPINVVQQNHTHLVRWLENSRSRNEETVSLSQFCEFLSNRSVEREQAVQSFNQFDTEGDGTADVLTMLEALNSCSGPNLHGELNYVIRTLQACSLIPGFIDVYSEDKSSSTQHGFRILNFLIRNRASSNALPFQVLEGFSNISSMRQSVLTSTFSKLTEIANKQINENLIENGAELRPLTKTFSRIDVSSNTADSGRLTNEDFDSYWQSDGLARSHWIRLWMKSNVVLKQLSVAISMGDQSYMPQLITVSVGRSPNNLVEIKEIKIPSHVKGDVQLVENLQTYYRCVQVTIRRCQSDGCDTRIRGIKTLGYRIVKDQGFSVLDASAVWYLQVMASTVTACRTLMPSLRLAVLDHTKNALQHMPPLSLSQASSSKPQFLSTHVLDEIDKFLADVSVDDNNQLGGSGLEVLLSLSLARGHVSSILKILQSLVENSNLSIPCAPLFKSMVKVRENFYKKSASQLTMISLGSDGGTKNESNPPSLVLSGNWMAPTNFYQTKEGKTKVNMFFKGQNDIQVVRVQIKVEKGSRGPKSGMIFVYRDLEDFDLDKHVERFSSYDNWKITDHNKAVAAARASGQRKPDDPVAFFVLEDDWDEIEIVLDHFPVGQNVLIKFLEPRQSTADHLGIIGVKFYGFLRKDHQSVEFDQDKPVEDDDLTSQEIVQRTLLFLKDIASEQPASKRGVFNKKQWLDMNKLTMDAVWQLYRSYINTYSDDLKTQCLILQLLHALLPHIVTTKQDEKVQAGSFFQHLCQLLDKDPGDKVAAVLMPTVKQVMVDGVSIFFPDKEARRKELFGMIDNISGSVDTPPSVQLIFQSLCQFYSSVDPTGLLDLPKTLEPEFDPDPFLTVMETLCGVVLREFKSFLDMTEMTEQALHLLSLVCSLQTSLLSWCHRQMTTTCSEDKENQEEVRDKNKKIVEPLVMRYSRMVMSKACEGLDLLSKLEEKDLTNCIEKMEKSFLSTTYRQLILLLSSLSKLFDSPSSVRLVRSLLLVAEEVKKVAGKAPAFFEQVNNKDLESLNTQEVVLRTWNIESPHNYHNNQHSLQVFYCPGATKFNVEFDARCETEKRYDYLEFTDARGYKVQYDQKVGSEKWPKTIKFRGPYLQFLFHSDGSSTEWGYKFTVQAKGCPDLPLTWIYDLQLGTSKLMGQMCSETLNSKKVLPKEDPLQEDKETKDVSFLRSDLWTALFRGGYRIGKLQRSLSGKLGALDNDSFVHKFLWEVLNQEGDLAKGLLQKCQEHCHSHHAGGESLDSVVIGIFAALLWHTQALREDLEKYVNSEGETPLTEGVFQAYTAAESVRNFMLDLRQRKKLAAEKENVSEEVTDYVQQFREKAEYLLSFAGLTKIQPKTELRVRTMKSFKRSSINRRMSATLLERQQSLVHYENPVNEKYPSFRLVLDFIKDPSIGKDKVHALLQQRSCHAQSVADVYGLASEYIKMTADPHIFQIPSVMFLKEMLRNQNNFAKHYADGIEGSGLELEAKVRSSYYTLLKGLIEAMGQFDRPNSTVGEVAAFDYIRACLLHFLDVNWQPYDYTFLLETKIPYLFMNIAKGSVATRSRGSGDYKEEDELKDYERNMKWFEKCKEDFNTWHDDCAKADKKALHMFIARFCDLIDVEIGCDGCHVTLPGRRYRCLQCPDVDLCATCFAGGVSPVGDHNDDHEMVHLMFKCDACGAFIVGQRVHCDVCDDFDLCLGCQVKGNLPSGHTAEHSVTKFPMVTLTTSKKCDSTLQAYIHQHVWLLFTSLTLNMANIVYTQPPALDADYQDTASQIHDMCTTLVTSCLEQVPLSDQLLHEDSLVEDPEKAGKMEIAFALHAQERIMGLLGAMISAEHVPFSFHTEKFLTLLFMVAKGESGHEVNTQHLAMGLLRHLLQRVTTTCKVCDIAVSEATGRPLEEGKKEGWHTIKYLFDFGAKCLERSSIEWAYSVSSILQGLFNSSAWREVLMDHVKSSILGLTDTQELSSIFALIVVAGFPDVLSVGTNVKYTLPGHESKNGVVLKHFPEKRTSLVVDKATRRRHLVADDLVDVFMPDLEIPDLQHTASLIEIIKNITGKLKQDDISKVGVESLWVLGLSLKALIKSGVPDKMTAQDNPMYAMDFVQCIVHLASRGTDFEKLWLLKDMEVLSLMLYTGDKQQRPAHPTEKIRTVSTKSEPELKNLAANISNDAESSAKETIELLSGYAQVLQATLNPLAAIMDENQTPATDILRELARKELGTNQNPREGLVLPEEIQSALSRTMSLMSKLRNPETPSSIEADKTVDTGIQLSSKVPQVKEQSMPEVLEAVEEPCEKSQNLVATPDNDVKKDVEKKRKQKSADLLKKAFEAQGKSSNRDYLMKVNLAIAILYSREVLIRLLADWPAEGDHVITAQLLGCSDSSQIPCVIDMLNRSESKDTINKLVHNLVKSCDTSCLVAIAMTGCHFLEELSLMSVNKESEHPYTNDLSFTDKVYIPGAAFLSVKFDKRCVSEETCDELVMATNDDYSQDKKTFSGAKDRWVDFEVPGDTLYYKFTTDCSNTDWGYKFIVSGGKTGRFDTGHMILNSILSAPNKTRLLPLDELWSSLIQVVCKQTGAHRLKIVQLLLHILNSQCRRDDCSPLVIDVCLLQPLWQLYTKMSSHLEPGTITSPLVRALTELFFVAENLALVNGIADRYAASLKTKEEWRAILLEGVMNVAAFGAGINYANIATDSIRARDAKSPEPKKSKEDGKKSSDAKKSSDVKKKSNKENEKKDE
ncbi:zinc finger ZZ-type and EF-hand domain-containing protein 1-like isoform X2 [Lineus longissimus]|uniref:zinc finger ZZ-type and EF-hand domain-containing protein 1-like isoform X2 n=1 Tax=Lineus longissimus TaxID=88925 RepID=UPI002B4FAD41